MDTDFQPADDNEARLCLLGRARHFILHLITYVDSVLERLGSAPMSAALARALTRRSLLPAESAMRRAILLIAAAMAPPMSACVGRPGQKGSCAHPRESQTPPPPRAPLFRMFDPEPPLKPLGPPKLPPIPEDRLPRVRVLTDAVLEAVLEPAAEPSPTHDPGAIFLRRFAALRAAFENPQRVARRWLARRVPASAPRSPLAPRKIPGAWKSLGQEALSLLRELTVAARATLSPNTS